MYKNGLNIFLSMNYRLLLLHPCLVLSDGGKEESIVSRGVTQVCKGTSPDTTSDRGDRKSVSPDMGEAPHSNLHVTENTNAEISPGSHQESEDISPGSRRNNLKLSRGRQKRNRYAEVKRLPNSSYIVFVCFLYFL